MSEKNIVVEDTVEKILEDTVEKVVEDTIEKVVEKVVEMEKTTLELVKLSLTNSEMMDKLLKTQIVLTPELMKTIETMITLFPSIFDEIEKTVLEIIKDGKIDSKDIPQLIIVVQKIYQIAYSLKMDSKKRSELTGNILRYFIHLLVLERKIKVEEDKETELLTNIDALISACVGLLSFPKVIKTKGCLQKLLKRV